MTDTVRDANGNEAKDGDSVTLIKGIRLTGGTEEVDCRHDKVKGLVLRAELMRKA